MRFHTRVSLAAFAALFISACSSDKGADKDAKPAASPDSALMESAATPRDSLGRPIGRVIREAVKTGYVGAGTKQPVTLELIKAPEGFPVQFSTYKTTDLQMASARIGSNASITLSRVVSAQSGSQGIVQIQFDTAGASSANPAEEALKSYTSGMKISALSMTALEGYPWAKQARSYRYTSEGRQVTGRIIAGTRGSHAWRILVQHAPDAAAAINPRLDILLRNWRWDDDFTYLVK
jgi:hypothetical protein